MSANRRIDYDVVHVGTPLFQLENVVLAERVGDRPAIVVSDDVVHGIYGAAIRSYLEHHGVPVSEVVIPSGEVHKSWDQVSRICKTASSCSLPRRGLLIALGGGVTLDIVGLAASLYRRGVGYMRIPTSLLAIVDAGVGIKQGVNFAGKKSMLGSFYPHETTLCDLRFLSTLPPREISSGFAEIIKMALVRSADLLDLVEEHGAELTTSHFRSPAVVAHDVAVKAQQLMMEELQANLYETELARLVDFGHTFSPYIEAANLFEGSHGHAVAIDILLTLGIGVERGLCAESLLTRVQRLFDVVGLSARLPPVDPRAVYEESLTSARLHRGGRLNMVVPRAPGEAQFVQEIQEADFMRSWERTELGEGSVGK